MHSNKTLIICCLIIAVLAFVLGRVVTNRDDEEAAIAVPVMTGTPFPTWSPDMSGPARVPVGHTIRLTAGGPVPKVLVIAAGDSVTMVSDGVDFWPVAEQCTGFDARRALHSGERYALTLNTRRTCEYRDRLDPSNTGRAGTVIVQ